jgi:hypothetical protein
MSSLLSLLGAVAIFLGNLAGPAVSQPPALVAGSIASSAARVSYPWTVHDSASSPRAFCTYDGGDRRRRVFVPVHMPLIFWPNTHAGRQDHGRVGWQIDLQVAPTPSGAWRLAYRSSITTGIATDSRAASIAKHAINWRVLRGHAWYRVRVRAIWYRTDGSRLATRTHLIQWYQLARANAPWHEGSPGGWNIGPTLGVRHLNCPSLLAR